jgi:hypothetical protein
MKAYPPSLLSRRFSQEPAVFFCQSTLPGAADRKYSMAKLNQRQHNPSILVLTTSQAGNANNIGQCIMAALSRDVGQDTCDIASLPINKTTVQGPP